MVLELLNTDDVNVNLIDYIYIYIYIQIIFICLYIKYIFYIWHTHTYMSDYFLKFLIKSLHSLFEVTIPQNVPEASPHVPDEITKTEINILKNT